MHFMSKFIRRNYWSGPSWDKEFLLDCDFIVLLLRFGGKQIFVLFSNWVHHGVFLDGSLSWNRSINWSLLKRSIRALHFFNELLLTLVLLWHFARENTQFSVTIIFYSRYLFIHSGLNFIMIRSLLIRCINRFKLTFCILSCFWTMNLCIWSTIIF